MEKLWSEIEHAGSDMKKEIVRLRQKVDEKDEAVTRLKIDKNTFEGRLEKATVECENLKTQR